MGTITSLTITGTMDASDFKVMRDEMPVLAEIDMSAASVTAYRGTAGPMDGGIYPVDYEADKVPSFAFCNTKTYQGKTTLLSVKLPKIRAVLFNAFWGCTNLHTVVMPSTVTTLSDGAFRECISLVNIDIPPFLRSLERYIFQGCTSLTAVTLPSTLISIKDNLFYNCTGLRAIHIISHTPRDFDLAFNYFGDIHNMFYNVDKERCILYVPYGTKVLYEAAEGWKDFRNIVEASEGFIVSADSLQFSSFGGSDNSIRISANTQWMAVSEEPWLTVSPSTGNGNAVLTITAEENKQELPRQAIITITAEGSPKHKITIIQKTNQGTFHVTPGSLTTMLSETEKRSITSLTLTGQIDARDFKTMRDEMPQLIDIDLRQASIVAYSGESGTYPSDYLVYYDYYSNTVPANAFGHYGLATNTTLQTVQIPLTTVAIGETAFARCEALTSFTVPSEVIRIDASAFAGCKGLTSFMVPATVNYISSGVFAECSSLKEVVLPPSLTVIPHLLFEQCSSLVSIKIPSGVTSIGNRAFAGCTSLSDINIPSGLNDISYDAFRGCTSLVNINLPSSVTTIGTNAFQGCTALKAISLPSGITKLGQGAFWECSSLTGKLAIPGGIKSIKANTFTKCSKLTAIEFHRGTDSISQSAFDGCIALSGDLTLPSTLRYVGERAFANCRSLNGTLTLPPHLTEIESFAFVDCRSLSAIIVQNPYPVPLSSTYAVFEGVDKSIPLQVPFGSKELYSSADVWKEFTNITEASQGMLLSTTTATFAPDGGSNNTITLKANVSWTATSDQPWLTVSPASGNSTQVLTITAQANTGMASRKGIITLSASGLEMQSIQVTQGAVAIVVHTTSGNFRSLFTDEQYNGISSLVITGTMNAQDIRDLKDMPVLSEVDMSGVSITIFHYRVYKEIYSLPANSFPSGMDDYAGIYSLRYDSSLTSIVLPSNLERIEAEAFKGCVNLHTVVFPSSLTYIGDYAFLDCASLRAVQLHSVTDLSYGAFRGCTSLSSVELNTGITSLHGTFEGCTSLSTIELPSTLQTIGNYTFKGCTKLTQIQIPSLVTAIGVSSFERCISLTSVILPASVTTIYGQAFAGCTTMSLVILPRSLTIIEDGAFHGCMDLTSVYCYAAVPPQPGVGNEGVFFSNVDLNRCILYVPYGSKQRYAQAVQWKEFRNIQEMEEFSLPVTSISMEAEQGSASIVVTSGTAWKATSTQSWLTITPASGTGSATVTLTAEANPLAAPRNATVNFNVNDRQLQDLSVIQKGIPATITLTPGTLSSRFSIAELMGMTRLVISGTMDARDFKTIRERMPSLTVLDLSTATILAYTGFEGTIASDHYELGQYNATGYYYPANEIPAVAFSGGNCQLLRSIVLPPTLSSIGNYAFTGLSYLETISIPSSVTSIGADAFAGCSSLTSVVMPPALIHMASGLFAGSGLTSVSIPATVTSMGVSALGACRNLTTIYSYAPNPPEIESTYYARPEIFGLDKTNITLYVPYGSKRVYAMAPNEWKEFPKVVEMPGFRLSAVTVAVKAVQGSKAKVGIASDVQWSATSNQSWLSISPSTGTGSDTLIFTAQANTMDAGRMAIVTISAPDVVSQTIMVIQEGKPRTIALTPGNMASVLTSEEMSGITHLTITGVMDARDFRVMRDQMPLLTFLDLSQVKIAEYKEPDPVEGKIFTNRVNMIPDRAFFDQKTWKGKTSLTQVIFPQTLEKIGIRAFSHAAGLTVLRFPFTMKYIESDAFNSCPYLTAITSHAVAPPESHIWYIPFYNVDKETCILYVPFGTKALYAEASNWKDFQNIVEMAEFKIMTSKATLKATTDNVRMRIQSQVSWTAEPSEQWLTVNPASGNDDQVITITAEANPTDMLRTGIVTFKAKGYLPQIFTVTQEGLYKTISLTAGTLSSKFSSEDLKAINGLIIKGTMDARDFKTIRDKMPWLVYLDLTEATITAYSGTEGTAWGYYNYKANAIPPNALYYWSETYKSKLSKVLLPTSLTLIDESAFSGASVLTSIIIPSSVNTIGRYAFSWTQALDTIVIPEGVDTIYNGVFSSSMILSSITIPSSIKFIGDEAFGNLYHLRSIYSYATVPLELPDTTNVFWQVYTDSCILYVPYGFKAMYAAAAQWKDFTHIVEMGGVNLSATELTMEAIPAIQTIQITNERAWSAVSDKEWLTVSPLAGTGDQILTFTADTNRMATGRTAIVTVTADTLTYTVTVHQKGAPTSINLTAGTLSTVLTADELLQTTELILTGEIDARDFKTMRDQMPNLAILDMSRATIVVYKGNEGTIRGLFTTYPANRIPPESFYNKLSDAKSKLTSVQLPLTAQSIGYDAFNSCTLLTDIKIFDSVNSIDEGVFKNCSSLTSLNLLTAYSIGKDAFNGCKSLTSLKFPYGLNNFGGGAFLGCSALNSIYSYMNEAPYLNNFNNVFNGIDQKTCTLYVAAGSKEKYEVADQWKDFEHIVEMTAPIISPKEITLEAHVGSSATITVSGIGLWTFGWDQSWLELDKGYGLDDQTITITIDEANTTTEDRICIVTIAPIGLDWQIVVVTQKGISAGDAAIISLDSQIAGGTQAGIATGVDDTAQNKPLVSCYPNPFTSQMSIDIANPALKEITVEIYSISGQKIRTLAKALKGQKISLDWDGEDEQGRRVTPGVYLLKMNEEVKKVVKR